MDRLYMVASSICARVVCLADWLFTCLHPRTTFPMTLRVSVAADGQQLTRLETYIACLACGRHFAYDWTAMRAVTARPARPGKPGSVPMSVLLTRLGETPREPKMVLL
jgi:hypothetical protein